MNKKNKSEIGISFRNRDHRMSEAERDPRDHWAWPPVSLVEDAAQICMLLCQNDNSAKISRMWEVMRHTYIYRHIFESTTKISKQWHFLLFLNIPICLHSFSTSPFNISSFILVVMFSSKSWPAIWSGKGCEGGNMPQKIPHREHLALNVCTIFQGWEQEQMKSYQKGCKSLIILEKHILPVPISHPSHVPLFATHIQSLPGGFFHSLATAHCTRLSRLATGRRNDLCSLITQFQTSALEL